MAISFSLSRRVVAVVSLCIMLVLAGCGGRSSSSSISISLPGGTLAVGQSVQLKATETTSGSPTTDVTSTASWSSSNTAVATISAAGVVTGVKAGTTTISATVQKTTGTLLLTVGAAAVTSIAIAPASASVYTGGTQQFSATATYSDGSTGDITKQVSWSVTPSSVATISTSGLLTAVAAGSFTVTANSGSVQATATGTVSNATLTSVAVSPTAATIASGGTQQFTATGTYSDSSTKDLTSSVTWSSSNTSVLTIASTGLATAGSITANTSATITATLGSLTATSAVTLTPAATMTSLVVRPTSSSIAPNTAEQHTATAYYSDGTQQDVTSQVSWSTASTTLSPTGSVRRATTRLRTQRSAGPAAGEGFAQADGSSPVSVDGSGIDTANQVGSAQLTATLGGLSSQSVVLVRDTAVQSVAISSTELEIPAQTQQQFTLQGTFEDGSVQDLSLTAGWQSSNTGVATIDSSGLLTAVSAGTTTISAGFGGATATPVTVQVLPVDLVSLTLKIPYPTIGPGATEQLAVIGTFSDGTQQDVTSLASWTSSNTTVMTINDSGFVQVLTSGRAEITASVLGVSAVAAIASEAATLQSLEVLPSSVNFALGTSEQFACLGIFSDGAQINLTGQVVWTSGNPTVLTINSSGLAKSGSIGSTTITASYLGISASTGAVNVTSATLAGITLAPTSSRIAFGTHQQYAATGWFNDGSVQDLTSDVSWSVSDPTVASVDSGGRVLGLKAGTVTVTAASQGQSASAPLTVTDATLVSTVISPGNTELPAGVTRQFSLIGTFSDGTTQDMTADAIWQSPTPTIVMSVAIDILGEGPEPEVGVGVSPGIGTLGAVYGNFSSATQVTVTNATLSSISLAPASSVIRTGGQQAMTATGTFSDGFQQNLYLNAVFHISNASVATILNATGVAYGTAVGTTQLTSTFDGLTSGASTLTVESGTLDSITLSPSNPAVTAGGSQQLTATGNYADGTTSDLSSQVTWTSSNPSALSVSTTGLATAHAVSAVTTVTVTATYGSVSQSFTVTISPANSGGSTVSSLAITPASPDIASGSTGQLTVTATYADGSTGTVTGLASWSSSNNAVATVDTSGLVTATGVGVATITASYGGSTATASVTVGQQTSPTATLTSIAVFPSNISISAGATHQYTARATYSDGTTSDITNSVTWASSSPAVATISSAGMATGVSAGTTQITAQSGSISGAATLTVTSPTVSSIAITPATAAIAPGATVQYHATATYPDGTTQDVTSTATWTSSNSGVATINNAGLATGVANGSTAISASAGGASGDASLTVASNSTPTLTSISVSPSTASVTTGGNQQFTATGSYSDGSTQDLTSSATWSSSSPSVAVVSSDGLASGVAAGTATITATSGSISGTATLTVTGSGSTVTGLVITPTSSQIISGLSENFTATATYGDGSTHNVSSSVTWSSSNPAVAVVNSSGQVTGVAPGTAVITGSIGSVTSQTTVVIEAATLSSLAISPSGASFAAGVTQQFTLTATYSNGTRQDVTSQATWSSTASNVATVSSSGLATGVAQGTAQISATFTTQSVATTVQITPATLVSVAVSPSSASFAQGTTQQFSVIGTYTDGTTQNLTSQATFSSSNPSVVSVSSSGLATGVGTGSAAITVSVDGQSATTQSVTVTPATLVSIAITPQTPSFAAGTTQQFTAIGTYSDGTTQDLTTQAVWYSNNPQVVTINSSGLASSSTSTGTAQISCTFNGVSATTGNVTVTPAVLTSLAIAPTTAQIAKGTTQQFTATGTYSDSSTQDLSSTVSWTSSDATVASISASGLATGNNVGSAQITASFNGQTASTSSFSVTPATLVSIAFSPANPSVAAGTSAQVTVTGTFSDGSTQNLSSAATYSSSNTAAVTVNASGVITGVATGSSTVTVTVDGVTNSFTATVTSATLSSIAITPANPASLPKGTTEQFTATGTYSDGSTQDLSSTVTWTSSNTAVLTVNTSGLASGAGVGTATLTAAYQGLSTTSGSVQVTPAVVASIAVTPSAATMTAGGTQQYDAVATYTDATTQDVTNSATWSSSTPTVATVTSTGAVVAVSQGTTTISAVYNGITGSTSLTVNPVVAPVLSSVYVTPSVASIAKGNTQQFAATGFYTDGSSHDLTAQAVWQSSVPSVASVSTSGLASGLSGGNTQIWATAGGVSGVAALTVSPATLVSLAVSPAAVTLAKGTSQQYTAIGTLSDGSTEDLTTSVTWTSSATSVATINSSGYATSVGTGATTITATASGISGSGAMTVTSATVVSVLVTPATVALPAGGTQQLMATAVFTDGTSQNVTTSATYASSNTGVVTASTAGLVTAVGAGAATLTVSLGATSTTVPVTITTAVLTSIAITPSPFSLAVGESQQMTATGTFSDGSTQNLTNSVAWTSSSPTVATVSLNGLVIASQPGTATISATNGLITASSTLTATSAVVTAIAVSPAAATLAAGQTQQYAATATMSDGSQQNVTSSVHWSTSNVANGTISNIAGTNGLLVTLTPGTFTVSAALNGVTGTASVTVTSAILTSLTITPSPVSLPAGTTQVLTVTGNYSDGSTANVTSTATWTTSSAATATVATGGTLSAVSPGSATVTAHVGLITQADAVTVTSAVLNSITINVPSGGIPLGLQSQITATGTYTDGSTQDVTSQVLWSSSVPSVATISSTGLVTTVAAGTTQIGASLNGVTQQTALTVSAAVLSSIAIQASQSSFALGLSLQLTAVGTYSDNSTQNLTSAVTWSSLSPSVGLVSSAGVATGLTTGTFTAKATLGSVSGTLTVTVTSAVLQSIVVTPANSTILNVLGSSVQYTATGHFSDGSTQNITTTCHWAITSGLSLGSISQTGSFSPLGVGAGTLSATSGSISGSTGFIVVSVL
ncbi:beta strand repeat-containing protein [Silvibacterium sp.]|uniref:beta strand repeat-containing protein n=1 Tax=Silvibacterium sp. TaxID=1964179 RepID=UPI0039E6D0D6